MAAFLLPLLPLLALTATAAAQGLLSTSGLPSCATSCPLLIQATQACGGTATTSQQIWSCFCQSAYLTTLHSSPNGICDSVCTAASDNQQLMQWYVGNCGSDYGASEHADTNGGAGQTGGTTVVVVTSTQAAGSTVVVPSSTATSGTSSGSQSGFGGTNEETGSWWSNHWKWIVMLIVLFFGLLALALVAFWLKRRHDRKADQIRTTFNPGITTRSAGPFVIGEGFKSGEGSGRATPMTMRDSYYGSALPGGAGGGGFMPYGYSQRSESRLGSQTFVGEGASRARGDTPVRELEKGEGGDKRRSRRVLVRERSVEDHDGIEAAGEKL